MPKRKTTETPAIKKITRTIHPVWKLQEGFKVLEDKTEPWYSTIQFISNFLSDDNHSGLVQVGWNIDSKHFARIVEWWFRKYKSHVHWLWENTNVFLYEIPSAPHQVAAEELNKGLIKSPLGNHLSGLKSTTFITPNWAVEGDDTYIPRGLPKPDPNCVPGTRLSWPRLAVEVRISIGNCIRDTCPHCSQKRSTLLATVWTCISNTISNENYILQV
jgi:hypothetical protein